MADQEPTNKPGRDPWETEAERRVIKYAGGREGFKKALRQANEQPPSWTFCLVLVAAVIIIALCIAVMYLR